MIEYITALSQVIRKPLVMRHTPIHIQLEPTTFCNLNCKMCGRSKYFSSSQHLGLEQFSRILKQIQPKKITLSGVGEPFMNPDLPEMVRLAKAQGCSVNTTTNCTLLTPELCDRIVQSGLDLVKISLDSATSETYRTIRGEDRFEQVLDGVRTLTAAKKRLGRSKPFIRFNYVMSKDNYHEIGQTVELAHTLGVDAIYFQPLELVGIEERYDLLVGDLRYEDFEREVAQALHLSRTLRLNTNLHRIAAMLPTYWKKYQMDTRREDGRICILPWFSAYVTVEGFIRPCCSFSQTMNADMGNIFETDMPDIWNGEKYQQFRKLIRNGKRPYPICQNCVPQTLRDIMRLSDILPGFLK
ncbi:radical SAM domain protein, putative [Candidatus Vecturithrix granuli]|uniref:Radical SAM domain protein, putative n=1 Tax=Vecturithrix granuli TaxID=1499967 RepID=A0A081BXF2_VECG1|nr:radical SAM domain protein, putative [Candidatus Vecturithrix granuli]